jgi:hypothetical protein
MPVIHNEFVGNENIEYAPSDMDLESISNRKSVDDVLDILCQAREKNQDIQVMDRVGNDRHFLDPILQERLDIEQDKIDIEDDIMKTLAEENKYGDENIEANNHIKATAIYERYIKKKNDELKEDYDAMNDIENEIRAGLGASDDDIIEVVSEEEITSNDTFQNNESTEEAVDVVETEAPDATEKDSEFDPERVIDEFREGEKEEEKPTISGKQALAAITALPMAVSAANEGEDYVPMTVEEFDDVPVTDISISDDEVANAISSKYADVSQKDIIQLIDVMKRFKNHEKFNVFNALPESLKKEILKNAAEVGADKSTINFFAKTFINDLINDTFFEREFKDFNDDLNKAIAPMGNIVGSVMDEYNDEIYEKFTTELLKKAAEIREKGDEEKAKEIEIISAKFDDAVKLTNIKQAVLNSHINRMYKLARDNWNSMIREYDELTSNVKPRPRNLNDCLNGLIANGVPEDYAKTIIYYVKNDVAENIAKKSLPEHVYSYYLTDSLEKLGYTAKGSKAYSITMEAINECVKAIDEAMAPLKARNSKKARKRNKKK